MFKKVLIVLFMVTGLAHTQLLEVVPPDVAFPVVFYHKGEAGTKFRIWVDGAIVRNWPDSEISVTAINPMTGLKELEALVPALSPGLHRLSVTAYNEAGESAPTHLDVIAALLPSSVSGFRIKK